MRTDLRLKQFIFYGIAAVGIGLFALGYGKSDVCTWIGVALLAVAIIIMLTIRCPNCGHHLVRRRWTVPKYCPECGHAVDGSEFED